MLRVPTNGVTLAAREWPGRARAIVAVHGLTSNHTVWSSVADSLDGRHGPLARRLDAGVITPHRPA